MKNELSCEIVRDLLPLYMDDVTSDVTKHAVDDHLAHCETCRKEAEKMRESLVLPINEKLQRSQANILKRIRKRFFRKKVVISLLSILAAVILLIGAYSYMTLHQTVIPYDGETVTVRELNGEVYASCTSDIAAGSVACIPSSVVIDGERKEVVAVYFYQTLWSAYVEPHLPFREDATELTFALGRIDGQGEQVDMVLYGDYDYQKLIWEEWQTESDGTIAGMDCVWKKTS